MTSTDHYEDSSYSYYSYSKQNAFKCIEKFFRIAQSALLLYMIFCFIFYLITVGIDVAKLRGVHLLVSLSLDCVGMSALMLGVRGAALEIWPYVLAFLVGIVLVTIGHGVTFLFRHPGLNTANFIFDLSLSLLAITYVVLLYRFEKLKPADYDVRQRMTDGEDELTDVEITGNRTSAAETGMELSDVAIDASSTNAEAKH